MSKTDFYFLFQGILLQQVGIIFLFCIIYFIRGREKNGIIKFKVKEEIDYRRVYCRPRSRVRRCSRT